MRWFGVFVCLIAFIVLFCCFGVFFCGFYFLGFCEIFFSLQKAGRDKTGRQTPHTSRKPRAQLPVPRCSAILPHTREKFPLNQGVISEAEPGPAGKEPGGPGPRPPGKAGPLPAARTVLFPVRIVTGPVFPSCRFRLSLSPSKRDFFTAPSRAGLGLKSLSGSAAVSRCIWARLSALTKQKLQQRKEKNKQKKQLNCNGEKMSSRGARTGSSSKRRQARPDFCKFTFNSGPKALGRGRAGGGQPGRSPGRHRADLHGAPARPG